VPHTGAFSETIVTIREDQPLIFQDGTIVIIVSSMKHRRYCICVHVCLVVHACSDESQQVYVLKAPGPLKHVTVTI